jgi:hypothetical protein
MRQLVVDLWVGSGFNGGIVLRVLVILSDGTDRLSKDANDRHGEELHRGKRQYDIIRCKRTNETQKRNGMVAIKAKRTTPPSTHHSRNNIKPPLPIKSTGISHYPSSERTRLTKAEASAEAIVDGSKELGRSSGRLVRLDLRLVLLRSPSKPTLDHLGIILLRPRADTAMATELLFLRGLLRIPLALLLVEQYLGRRVKRISGSRSTRGVDGRSRGTYRRARLPDEVDQAVG